MKRIAVFDIETDPFLFGRVPKAFAIGFYDGCTYIDFWGDDCVQQFISYMESCKHEYLIYGHNAGKFDFFYLLRAGALEGELKIINGRIVKAQMGKHEVRDSYAIFPIPLAAYKKDEIDYTHFEVGNRERYKSDILHYLSKDCEYLFELVSAYTARFGRKLTVGGTAMSELKKHHNVPSTNDDYDTTFRPFYYGGRVECFESGVIIGKFKSYDVNSMYPHVMSTMFHPDGPGHVVWDDGRMLDMDGNIDGDHRIPYFVKWIGDNLGAVPTRAKDGLDFNVEFGEFLTPSHEFKAALSIDAIHVQSISKVFEFTNYTKYSDFVDTHMADKIAASESGDAVGKIMAKLMLNSAYGKFGQNPRKFKDYKIVSAGSITKTDLALGWDLFADYGEFEIWELPNPGDKFLNVATAASITSGARAALMLALNKAERPLYCDTDSIICENLDVDTHDTKLGAWKLESAIDRIAIAGKKLYVSYLNGDIVKRASKGVNLSGQEIIDVCNGIDVMYNKDAPNFKLSGRIKFVSRNIKNRLT